MTHSPVPVKTPAHTYLSGRRTRIISLLGLTAALLVVIALAVSIGSVPIPFSSTFGILLDKLPFVDITPPWQSVIATVVLDIRLPRVILAGLVGASLAVGGAT